MKKIIILIMLMLPSLCFSQDVDDYLILHDIGIYKLFTGIRGRVFSAPPSKYSMTNTGGILHAIGHLQENDNSYEASYTAPDSKWPFVKVEVTQHTGGYSDKWLLHEVEKSFRTYYGMPGEPYAMHVIDGNTIMAFGSAGWTYRWVSDNNKIIEIEYYDSQMEKPEPIEVVKAYLTKHPSSLIHMTSADLRTNANKTKWIKDEMERRLWLCDKWIEHKDQGKVDVSDLLRELHDHMKVFLNYKEKYYGIETTDEKNAIYGYMQSKDEAAMKNKLTKNKSWWSANKDGAIRLP